MFSVLVSFFSIFFSGLFSSVGFSISSCSVFNSDSEAFFLSFSSPYIGITSRSAWFIIFSSFILISSGLNFFLNFPATSWVKGFDDSGIDSKCSFGTIRECPLLRGFSSSIAM